ncbi:hypothetical protein JCGZ_10251 [Jatropha curcas]|uniref:Cytochrome P450 n=2 Tax=Jatropha curcas TaxID=180498 RepID=A0A067LD51_JATCU|nr:hypothetical protein JCGZ_10251 [Jatropha curcas]
MIPDILWHASKLHDFTTSILEQSGGTFLFKGIWFSGSDFLLLSDPINLHYILSRNFPNYHKGKEFKEIFEPLGNGIFNSDNDSWRIQRRIVHSFLKDKRFELAVKNSMEQKILKGLFLVLDNASKLESEVDMQDVIQRFTFDNICHLVLGFDPTSLCAESHEVAFEKAFDEIEEIILYRHLLPGCVWKLQRWLQIGEEKKFTKAWRLFDGFLQQCITRKQKQLAQQKSNDFDLLTFFLMKDDHQDQEEITKSDKFLADLALNLLSAGRDTIGAALVWLFWLVGKHPLVEKKILEEIKENLQGESNNWRLFNFEELKKLVYLHATICEVLRLYPPVPFEHKTSIKPDVLPSGHHVPENMRILYSLYSMGRMKDIWGEDCLEFRPERWISEKGRIKHFPSYKFIAFNSGPRTCLGKDLAFIKLKTVASAVLWNYSLRIVEDHHISPKISVILYMDKGLKVKVSKRFASLN